MEGFRTALRLAIVCLAVSVAQAAEWSIAPTLSWTMDHASNRYLVPQAPPGEGALVTLDAVLKRSTAGFDMAMEPTVSLQRYTTGSGADTANRSVNLSSAWSRERSTFKLLAGYSDWSTLTSELTSTGVVQGDTRQRHKSAQGSWQLQQSELLELDVQAYDDDVSYVGQQAATLNGYRYPTLSIGERFKLRPQTSLTVTAFGGELSSPGYADKTRDEELRLTLEHSFSELLSTLATVGASQQSFGTTRRRGYVGQLQLTRAAGERNQWSLSYQHALAPSGYGALVLRDQGSLSVTRQLAPRLSGTLGAFTNKDTEILNLGLPQQARRYDSLAGSLNWSSGETSTIGVQVLWNRAIVTAVPPVPTEKGWQASISYTWTPRHGSISR